MFQSTELRVWSGDLPDNVMGSIDIYNNIIKILFYTQFKDALIDWVFCGRNPFEKEESEADTPGTIAATRPGQISTVSHAVSRAGRNKKALERTMSCATEISDIGATTPIPHRRQILVAPAKPADCADTVEELQEMPSTSGEASFQEPSERKSPPAETCLGEGKSDKNSNKTLKPPASKTLKNRATVTPLPGQPTMDSGPTKVDT